MSTTQLLLLSSHSWLQSINKVAIFMDGYLMKNKYLSNKNVTFPLCNFSTSQGRNVCLCSVWNVCFFKSGIPSSADDFGWCNSQTHSNPQTIPTLINLMSQHLNTIGLVKSFFCIQILPNCLHFMLKLKLWISFQKKDITDLIVWWYNSSAVQCWTVYKDITN